MTSVADISLLVTKITFVVAEILIMEDVITSHVAKITFIVGEVICKELCHFFRGVDHLCCV